MRALLLAILCLLCLSCTGDPARRTIQVSVLAVGASIPSLERANNETYRIATDNLMERIQREGGGISRYQREVIPLDDDHASRAASIAALSASLYAAAGIIEAARAGASRESYLPAAARTLDAVDRLLRVLSSGTVLPPVPIPEEITAATGALRALVGVTSAQMDAGPLPG